MTRRKLTKKDIESQFGDIIRVNIYVLYDAIDYLKEINLFQDFLGTIKSPLKEQFIEIIKQRPKKLGGNPFD